MHTAKSSPAFNFVVFVMKGTSTVPEASFTAIHLSTTLASSSPWTTFTDQNGETKGEELGSPFFPNGATK